MESLDALKQNVDTAQQIYNDAVRKFNASKTGMLKRGNKDLRAVMVDAEIALDKAKEELQEYYDQHPEEAPEEEILDIEDDDNNDDEEIELPVIKQRGNVVPNNYKPLDMSKVVIHQKGKPISQKLPEAKSETGDPVIVQGVKKAIKAGSDENRKAYKA